MRTLWEVLLTLWEGLTAIFPTLLAIWLVSGILLRIAIVISLVYPVLIILFSLIGYPWLTSIISIIGIYFFVMVVADPLILGSITAIKGGTRALFLLGLFLGSELLFAIYFIVVPVNSAASLIPIFLVVTLALVFLPSYDPDGTKKFVIGSRKILTFLAIGITILFFLYAIIPSTLNAVVGKVSKMDGKISAWISDTASAKSKPTVLTVVVGNPTGSGNIVAGSSIKKDSISFPVTLNKGETKDFDLRQYSQNQRMICVSRGMVLARNSWCQVELTDSSTRVISGEIKNLGRQFTIVALSDQADFEVSTWKE